MSWSDSCSWRPSGIREIPRFCSSSTSSRPTVRTVPFAEAMVRLLAVSPLRIPDRTSPLTNRQL